MAQISAESDYGRRRCGASFCAVAARRQACGREGVSKLPHSKVLRTARLFGRRESRRSPPRALWSAAEKTPLWLSEKGRRPGSGAVSFLPAQSGVAAALCHRTPRGFARCSSWGADDTGSPPPRISAVMTESWNRVAQGGSRRYTKTAVRPGFRSAGGRGFVGFAGAAASAQGQLLRKGIRA